MTLTSSPSLGASAPQQFVVPAGATMVSFSLKPDPVLAPKSVVFAASYGGTTWIRTLTLLPAS